MSNELALDHPLMERIRALAEERDHKLAPYMTGTRPLAIGAANAIVRNLEGRPMKNGGLAIPAGDGEFRTRPASGYTPPQPAAPAEPERTAERDPSWPRWLHVGAGIYFLDGEVYRVYQSQYSPHYWMCKVLDKESVKDGGSRWAKVNGIISKLRPEHEMTAEQSVQFEELYGITVCTRCGAELEADDSRELRIGPVCRTK